MVILQNCWDPHGRNHMMKVARKRSMTIGGWDSDVGLSISSQTKRSPNKQDQLSIVLWDSLLHGHSFPGCDNSLLRVAIRFQSFKLHHSRLDLSLLVSLYTLQTKGDIFDFHDMCCCLFLSWLICAHFISSQHLPIPFLEKKQANIKDKQTGLKQKQIKENQKELRRAWEKPRLTDM